MKKQYTLITGGAGFLGSHLCEFLLFSGYNVICLDNYSTGGFQNIEHLVDSPNFKVITHDVTNEIKLDYAIDKIYNLASPASPVHYQENPVKTIQTNVIGMNNVLELARKNKARVFQASTSEVYGDPLIHPQIEEYWGNVNPIGIRSCYDEGKRCAEALCFDYHRQYDVDIRVARIFNTYGPRMMQDDGRVVSNFIVQALHDKPITINGNGSQTRAFCYVDDLIQGLYSFMEQDQTTGPINIGNPVEYTIKEVANLVIELTKSNSPIIFKDLPEDDPKKRLPNIEKAKNILNWEPTTTFNAGLIKTIEYFKKQQLMV